MNEVKKRIKIREVKKKIKKYIEKVFEDRIENPDAIVDDFSGRKIKIWWFDNEKVGIQRKPFELNEYEFEELISSLEIDDNNDELYEKIEKIIHDYEEKLSPVKKKIWLFKNAFADTITFYTTEKVSTKKFVEICSDLLRTMKENC